METCAKNAPNPRLLSFHLHVRGRKRVYSGLMPVSLTHFAHLPSSACKKPPNSSGAPVTLHAARKWLNGEALPAQDKLRVLATWLEVASEWLRYGDEGDERAAPYRARARARSEPAVDFELAREIGALSPAHRKRCARW